MTPKPLVVAIDGPAGAGKSTVTRMVAESLGYLLLDTGALYRCIALECLRNSVSWDDEDAVAQVAARLATDAEITFSGVAGEQRVWLRGDDVTEAIRTQEVGMGASRVSAIPRVRASLLALQRGFADRGPLVAEGRDVGTVVFPKAEAKFFLTASNEERAMRRYRELCARGCHTEFEDVLGEVIERDRRDSEREIAPLRQAPDAMVVDSTGLTIEQVVARIVAAVRGSARAERS